MRFETTVETATTVVVFFDEAERPEITKPFAPSKRIRLESIRLRYVVEADGRTDQRVYGYGQRVLSGGRLGARESLGEFGMDPRRLPESLREAYQAALFRVEAR